jgi:formylglycine-generating enzyme required for sulfatase activity
MRLSSALICSGFAALCSANNIQVTNPALTGNTGTSAFIQFDLSWENSWRGGGVANWDAAWIFVKYRQSTGIWDHVRLNNTGHVAPAGGQIDLGLLTPGTAYDPSANPVVGVFIRRAADGTGNFSLTGVQLNWDYSALGIAYNDITELRVFALEMVYVTPGAFAAGTGGTEPSAFQLTTINTANATILPGGSGSLGGVAGGIPPLFATPSTASWPNGFTAFYCMKYELSQQGYVDFLNTLTYTQQVTRTENAPSSVAGTGAMITSNANRNGIDIQTPGTASTVPAVYACNLNGNTTYDEPADGQYVACNYLSWGDHAAYLDWSGLRVMTEMEFEKACRGPQFPLPDEYAWGTTTATTGVYTLSSAGTSTEGIATNYSTTGGNANYNTTNGAISGPLRAGIFAGHASNLNRVTAGATYYGIMQMSDNAVERCVTLGAPEGRTYTGLHGNGVLLANGDNNVANWPSVSTAVGTGFRGGSWVGTAPIMRVSDRTNAATAQTTRTLTLCARAVRNAP